MCRFLVDKVHNDMAMNCEWVFEPMKVNLMRLIMTIGTIFLVGMPGSYEIVKWYALDRSDEDYVWVQSYYRNDRIFYWPFVETASFDSRKIDHADGDQWKLTRRVHRTEVVEVDHSTSIALFFRTSFIHHFLQLFSFSLRLEFSMNILKRFWKFQKVGFCLGKNYS